MAQKLTSLTFPDKPRNLKIGAELNRGAWGAVYNGELEGHPVAVKRIHELLHQGGEDRERIKLFEDFRGECKKLQALSHPHVIRFIGAFNDPRLGPILVMEKMQENLRQFLDKCKKKLRLSKQLRISLEIIRGVAFLHQQTPPLIHRDLNDKNVMFSFEGVIKIGDFGQSKLKKGLYLTSCQPGMVTFMPPEALVVDTSKYNESLDIFSVGVLMLEIGTQQEPLVNLHGIGVISEVERRERDLKALSEDHPLRPQILLCLRDKPKERPKASDLQRELLALVDGGVEAIINQLQSQITTLQAALERAREKTVAWKEQAAKLTSEFQDEVASSDADRRLLVEEKKQLEERCGKLEERCVHLEAQATTYKLDFEEERSDREKAMCRLEEEREAMQAASAKLTKQLREVQLKPYSTISAQLQWFLPQNNEEMLPQSPLPPALGKKVSTMKLPDMPMGALSYGATIHNSKVYISAFGRDRNGKHVSPVLVCSTNKHKWSTFPEERIGAAIAVINNRVTLIGGQDVLTRKFNNTHSTWYEEKGRWKQVLPPMPKGRYCPAVISHDDLLLVTGGVAEDESTVLNTTNVLDLTTMKWSTPEGLNLPVPLWRHHLALCGEYLYLVGGAIVYPWQPPENLNFHAWRGKWNDVKQTTDPQHSQSQRGVWTRIAEPPTLCPTLVSCEGTLYAVGGSTRDDTPISSVYKYIPARNQWVSVGDMSVGRVGHCAVPLSSKTIFVAGGRVVHEGQASYSSLAEHLQL